MSRKSRLQREALASHDTTLAAQAEDSEQAPSDVTDEAKAEDSTAATEDSELEALVADELAAESAAEDSAASEIEAKGDDTTDAEDRLLAAIALCEIAGYVVRKPIAATPRATVQKADPAEVKAYFDSTGMTRKQLAAAVGVSTSVIATVQNPNGDRWSQVRYDAAKVLIEEERTRLLRIAALVAAAQAEIAAAAAAPVVETVAA